jgi:hypothetical protein
LFSSQAQDDAGAIDRDDTDGFEWVVGCIGLQLHAASSIPNNPLAALPNAASATTIVSTTSTASSAATVVSSALTAASSLSATSSSATDTAAVMRIGELRRMNTHPAFRRVGLARALIGALLTHARDRSFAWIELGLWTHQARAVSRQSMPAAKT